MAQFDLLDSRRGMLAGSFLMVVGVAVGGGDVTVDMVAASLGDEGGEGVDGVDRADRGTKDPEGLFDVVVGWAGPITCR